MKETQDSDKTFDCNELNFSNISSSELGNYTIGDNYDVTVIGASIGGTSAALQLAKLGFSVLLIDKTTFPRYIPCGEGLSKIGIEALAPLLSQSIRSESTIEKHLFDLLPHHDFYSYSIRGNCTIVVGGESRKRIRGRGISRYCLDDFLLKVAKAHPLIEVASGLKVLKVTQSRVGIEVFLAGSKVGIRSRFGVIASGKSHRFLAECGFEFIKPKLERIGASAEFKITDSSQALLKMSVFVKPTFEVYCTPVSSNRINISVLATSEAMSSMGRKRGILDLFDRTLGEYGISAQQDTEILGSAPSGARLTTPCVGRLIAVGDALESLDPVGGMGMTQAIVSGRLSAYGISASFKEGTDLKENCLHMRRCLSPLRQTTFAAALVVRTFSRYRSLDPLYKSGLLDFIEERMFKRHIAWGKGI